MEAGEPTGLCNRLYNFFARHFTSQRTKLVTLGSGGGGAREDFHPVATVPMTSINSCGGGAREDFHPVATVPVTSINNKPVLRAPSNIDELSDEFIQSRKKAIRSEPSIRIRSPRSQ